jgi:VanZ family protein
VTQQRPVPDGPRAADGELPAGGSPRARALLLLVCAALVVHGSLYPYHFIEPESFQDALAQLLARRRWWTSRGDVLGNVVLFVPLGVLGQWVAQLWVRRRSAATLVLLAGTATAFGLQVAQLYVPERDAELADVLWNAVGLWLGITAALLTPAARLGLAGRPLGRTTAESARLRLAAALTVLWLSLNWWPFVPTLDWAHVKSVLKGVVAGSHGSLASLTGAALGVMVISHLLRPLHNRRRVLWSLCATALLGRLITSGQWMSLSLLLGVLGGVVAAEAAWRAGEAKTGRVLFWAAVMWFALDALRPYQLAQEPHDVHWLPFEALLHGSMLSNLLSLCWNLFWIGAAVSLAAGSARPLGRVTVGISVGVAGLELIQTHLPGRVADITPALLPTLWWLVVRAVLPRHGVPIDGTTDSITRRTADSG